MTTQSPATPFDTAMAAAQCHVDGKQWREAVAALNRAVSLRPDAEGAWRALGSARRAAGDMAGATDAHVRAARLSRARSLLRDAFAAIAADRLADAETAVRARLAKAPNDTAAILLLADLAERAGNVVDAVRFLRHALQLAPGLSDARQPLALLLYRNRHLPEALAEFDTLLATDPTHKGYRNTKASILDLMGDHEGALTLYRAMLAEEPDQPLMWMTLGNVLKTTGAIPDSIAAYRRSLALAPSTGESWWGLANLKSFRFSAEDMAAMQARLADSTLADADRLAIDFALGKAFEDARDFPASFAHYAAANRVQLTRGPNDMEGMDAFNRRCAAFFTPELFAAKAGMGDPAPDPIFVLGMPRSGSTLVEQILDAHPLIEATAELPELPRLARALGEQAGNAATAPYPDSLARLPPEQFAALGAEYLRRVRTWRRTDRPYFVDKLPMNFVSVGLIRLILPNAKIIDVRRHPLGSGFAIFRQYFPGGATFSSALDNIGHAYASYARLMALWDERLPGVVHRVIYEDLVADTEGVVRRMLDHLGVPFDPACLSFHESGRPVRTPSAEQVRQPIYISATDHWRNYEQWLDPMKQALGDVLTFYPTPPAPQ